MFPLVDILEEEPKDLVVAKQYTKVLEAKFLQVSKYVFWLYNHE